MTPCVTPPPDVSFVIPAFNEALRLPESLFRLRSYLDQRALRYEVLVVDDGSTDGTSDVVVQWSEQWPAVRLIAGEHCGKGGAVRAGVLAAKGAYVALADADFSMPPEQFDRFSAATLGDYDMAIGSREATGARRYDEPTYRHVMGRVFNALVRALLLPGIQDSQCGFKCMRSEVALDLFRHQTIPGWGFDVELLYIAQLRGYHVREVPVSWYYVRGSRVHPIRDTLTMMRDVLMIYANGRAHRYDRRPVASEEAPCPVRVSPRT